MTEGLTENSRISPSEVREYLHTRILGQAALYFRTLTSTNDIAKQLAAIGTKEGTIVVAEIQSNGKGRLGRKWVSPEGGLWFSVIFRPKVRPKHALKLTLLGSVAVVKTVNRLYGLRAKIKWPNDVLINQKKVCGILTESEIKGKNMNFAVLGFGINANLDLNAFPQHLRDSATTLKAQLRKKISREVLLCRLLENVETCYDLFKNRKFETILDDWRRLSGFLGSYVEILDGQRKVEGRALDLDGDGALIVRLKDQNIHQVISGDVARIVQAKRPGHNDK
jgi:BirA family biotin operon repressor/biotin-[acetyl-CoA-carboxylase] ligase